MRGKAHGLLFSLATVWISFVFIDGSFVTFHTQEGCNATLLCNQPGNVTWLDSHMSQLGEGPRFQTTFYGFFSTLSINGVSQNDEGNITCVGQERNITISLEVCYNKRSSTSCDDAVQNGNPCNDDFMINNCKKSCGLCPAPNCTKMILPVIPTTGKTQTTSIDTDPSSTLAPTGSRSTQVEGPDVRNSGASWRPGFQGLFALVSALSSILNLLSLGLINFPISIAKLSHQG